MLVKSSPGALQPWCSVEGEPWDSVSHNCVKFVTCHPMGILSTYPPDGAPEEYLCLRARQKLLIHFIDDKTEAQGPERFIDLPSADVVRKELDWGLGLWKPGRKLCPPNLSAHGLCQARALAPAW